MPLVSVVGMMISCDGFIPVRVGVRIVKISRTGIVFLDFSEIGVGGKTILAHLKK